eukprot:g3915.t1
MSGEGNEENDSLTIKLKNVNGEETFFKVKKTTKMSKIADAYCRKKGLNVQSLRFLLDGDRVDLNETPKTLELDDQDQIDVMQEQLGGR